MSLSARTIGWIRRWNVGGTVAVAAMASLVVACGGGGDGGSVGITPTATGTAYATGPVSGFGSIIVNGVRFDDSSAIVEDDDGNRSSRASVKLGSMVEIESGKVDDTLGSATAMHIRFGSEIVGPVASVDASTSSFVTLGQTVEVRPETVFDDSLTGGLTGLAGHVVEVHALFDAASGHYIATRVEDASNAAFFKLRGLVSKLDPGQKTFQIGEAQISYANVASADLPANFADGQRVRVRLQKTTQTAGQWVAVTIRTGIRKVEDHDDARLQGIVTTVTSPTLFAVNGIPVDATNARIDNGVVTVGARVEVRGAAKDGTVVASSVKVLHADDDEVRGVELHGAISDLTGSTFVLRGVTVNFSGAVMPMHGGKSQLINGAMVEVKGVMSADRSTLTAHMIKFDG